MTKPIIVIKLDRTSQTAKAAASQTGSLAGRDDVLDAVNIAEKMGFESIYLKEMNVVKQYFSRY